mmetsp:Transcript_112721/g.218433  ORF Transcript_112721/g.218433 Transcript_112721/m.218433 type:complete len:195 (+) Transcript_112721:114-698(+)
MFGGLLEWIWNNVLGSLGLQKKQAKILFLGLDNAGKSTLLYLLKHGTLAALQPTLNPHLEELQMDQVKFQAWDLGGHETARRLWRDYAPAVNGIVFIVDAADRTRFEEVKEELGKLLSDPCFADVPVAVLGNKIDIPVAASEHELRVGIGLPKHMTVSKEEARGRAVRPVELFMASVVKKMGYKEAFQWLSRLL